MRIALICGSPKVKNSASEVLLKDIERYFEKDVEIVNVGFHTPIMPEGAIEELSKADAWVFAYPLYVDGIPGHLLSCLGQLEEADLQEKQIRIYGIVNCGFYEGIQAQYALKLLQNFSLKIGCIWSGGVGVGGGGGLAMMPQTKTGQGPKAPIEKALSELANVIIKDEVQENNYVSVAFPRFLYKLGAQMGWRQMIKANGGKSKDLGKIPE